MECTTGIITKLLHLVYQVDHGCEDCLGAATPVVCGSKDSSVEDLDELNYSVVEEPVCEGWVLDDLALAVLESGLSG